MLAEGIQPDAVTASALLSALASVGDWERASEFFYQRLPQLGVEPNDVAYNALVAACAAGGQWGQAASAFLEMRRRGLAPDRATYNPLLSALWAGGQFAYAQAVLRTALEEGVFDSPVRAEAARWEVDLHSFSAGAAQALLVMWLKDCRALLLCVFFFHHTTFTSCELLSLFARPAAAALSRRPAS